MKRHKPILEFLNLTETQKEQIFTWWFEEGLSYVKMRVRIREDFGIDITRQKIQKQCERWLLAQELDTTEQALLDLLNGDGVDFSVEGLKTILEKAFVLLARGEHTASALKMLQNIFDYNHRRQLQLNRDTRAQTMVEIAKERLELAKRADARDERKLVLAESKAAKSSGPTPTPAQENRTPAPQHSGINLKPIKLTDTITLYPNLNPKSIIEWNDNIAFQDIEDPVFLEHQRAKWARMGIPQELWAHQHKLLREQKSRSLRRLVDEAMAEAAKKRAAQQKNAA